METSIKVRNRKSVKLTSEEIRSFRKYVRSFRFLTDAAEDCGLRVNNIQRALFFGSAAPETVKKIRSKI